MPTKPFQNQDREFAAKHYRRVTTRKPAQQLLTPQEHHDKYVKLYKESLASGSYLNQEQFMEYQLALAREKAGEVKPLK